MNNEDLIKQIENLKKENENLKNELIKTQEHLKKYTSPSNMKKYYEIHKEEIKEKVKEYREKTNYYANISSEKKKDCVLLKQQAAKDLGYEYEIWIYDAKANKVETIL